MKRLKDSDIIPLIVAAPNIRQAIFAVLRGTDRKESPQGREILAHIDGIEAWLAGEISAGIPSLLHISGATGPPRQSCVGFCLEKKKNR